MWGEGTTPSSPLLLCQFVPCFVGVLLLIDLTYGRACVRKWRSVHLSEDTLCAFRDTTTQPDNTGETQKQG